MITPSEEGNSLLSTLVDGNLYTADTITVIPKPIPYDAICNHGTPSSHRLISDLLYPNVLSTLPGGICSFHIKGRPFLIPVGAYLLRDKHYNYLIVKGSDLTEYYTKGDSYE